MTIVRLVVQLSHGWRKYDILVLNLDVKGITILIFIFFSLNMQVLAFSKLIFSINIKASCICKEKMQFREMAHSD